METNRPTQVNTEPVNGPVLTPGWQCSELYLALAAIALVIALLCQGKMDQTCATALLSVILTSYPASRSWLKARHLDAVASVLSAQAGIHGAQALKAVAEAVTSRETTAVLPPAPNADTAPEQPPGSGAGVGPKAALVLLALGSLFLTGCSQTVLYSPHSGQRLASFQGDMTGSHYHGGGVTWDVQQVSHSAATLAGGEAFKMGADSVGTSVVSGIMAGGLPWSKAVAGGTQILAPIMQTAAPVVLQSKH